MRDTIPVAALSLSSIRTLRMCPEKWRRRYVSREYEPTTPPQLLGKVFGAAECQSDHHWIDTGAPLPTDDVLDCYSDEFDFQKGEDVNWRGEEPERLKDSGVDVLRLYHATVPALPAPVEAEREFRLEVEDIEFTGFIDVEREDGAVEDRKLVAKRITQGTADHDPQASAYLAARRAEGDPADRFVFDTAIKTNQPKVERVTTDRTDAELDHFLLSILGAADELEWRLGTDNWSFAPPGAWWCSQSQCGYWDSCPAGGLLRKHAARAVGGDRGARTRA